MKTKKMMGVCVVLGLGLSFASVSQANDHQYLNSDPIDINGYVHAEVEPTDQELENVKGQLNFAKKQSTLNKVKAKKYKNLAHETEKLSETSEELIHERAAAQKDIHTYQKKIDCLMGRASGGECDKYNKHRGDEVKTGYAAPSHSGVTTGHVKKTHTGGYNFGETIKVLPYTGFTNFITDNESLEAGINLGLQLESNVSRRFAVGIGVKYTTFTTEDYGGNGNFSGGLNVINARNQFNSFGREIEYSNINIDLYSKFFFLDNSRFRPYVGAGLGYNRTNLEYGDNNNQQFDNFRAGDEEVTANSISFDLAVGSEVLFTDTIGLLLEFNYTRGFGGNISSENRDFGNFFAPDQERLEDLSEELQEANIISLYAGFLVQF